MSKTDERLNELADIREQISELSEPFKARISKIKEKEKVALGDLPEKAKVLENIIKAQCVRTGRTFVGTNLQAVFIAGGHVSFDRASYAAIKKVGKND